MPSRSRILVLIVPLLTAGATAHADQASPLPSIMPKNGIFGVFSSDKSAAKRPAADVSGTPASNGSYWTDVQGGSLLGFAGVEAAERCTGKLCNAYYGDPPPDDESMPSAASPSASGAAPAITPSVPENEPRDVALVPRAARPDCTPNPQDPWRCYR